MNTLKIITVTTGILTGSYFVAHSPLTFNRLNTGKYDITAESQQPGKQTNTSNPTKVIPDANNQVILDQELGIVNFRRQAFVPGIVFRIQVLSSTQRLSAYSNLFDGCPDVREYLLNGNYKYTVGGFKSPGESNDLFVELSNKGFEDAFMVAFKDDMPIPVKNAMALIRKR